MSAIRLPLLCAFAGGCLSSAVLFGIWRADNGAAAAQQPRARSTEVVAPSSVEPNADALRTVPSDSPPARDDAAQVAKTDRAHDAADQPPAPSDAPDVTNAAATPGSSAVSDVLTDLEAAYRQRLIAAARAEAEAAPQSMAANIPPAPVDPPPEVATRAVAPVVPVSAPAVPPPSEPPPSGPPPSGPPPSGPPPSEPPAIVAQNDVRPPDVHIGDVNQNTYNITNVRQGDVYVTQQLAMLQYMQFMGAGSNPALTQPALPQAARRGMGQHPTQQFRQFPSTLTNLDNPWGFNFAPPHLVH